MASGFPLSLFWASKLSQIFENSALHKPCYCVNCSMSYQFGFGWAKSDPNDLSLREERFAGEFSHVKMAESNPGAFVLPFTVDSEHANTFDSLDCFHFSGDFEQISIQMASRYLLQYPGCTAFPSGGFPILYTDAKPSVISLMKNKLSLSLSIATSEDGAGGARECHHHSVMFSVFDCLLKQGFQSFATDDQLRGVVARFVSDNMMEVCLLRNCVINDSGEGHMNFEVVQYKCSPLRIEDIQLRQLTTLDDGPGPVWRAVEFPTQCVFLPTSEEVQLLAVATYDEARAAATITTTTDTSSLHGKIGTKYKTFHTSSSKNITNADTSAHRAAYDNALLLTPLDRLNRARGFSAYLPDTYSKARQYWELAYGINLPAVPDNVGFARILTSLGEVIVPQLTLARGVAEVPWKNTTDPQHCAAHVYTCLQHRLPTAVRTVHPPQHPDALAQQLRDVYMEHHDHVAENRRAEGDSGDSRVLSRSESNSGDRRPSQVPTKTLFVSALRMKEVAQKNGTNTYQPTAAVVPAVARLKPSTASTFKPSVKATPLKNVSTQAATTKGVSRSVRGSDHKKGYHDHDSEGDLSDGEDDFFNDADSLFGTTKASARVPVAPATTPLLHTRPGPSKPTTFATSPNVPAVEKSLPAKRSLAAAEADQPIGVRKHTIARSGGNQLDGVDSDSESSDIIWSDSSESSSSCLLTQDSLQPAPAAPLLPSKPPLPSLPLYSPAGAPTSLSSTSVAVANSNAVVKTKPVRASVPAPAPATLAIVRETLPAKSTFKPKSNRAAKK